MKYTPLKKYLHDIALSKPINLLKFQQLIQSLNLSHRFVATDITAEKHSGKNYLITNINTDLKQELQQLVAHYHSEESSSRINQAMQNNSHSQHVDGSFLLVRNGINHPQVALINGQGIATYPAQQNRQALIIENRELFLKVKQTQTFLESYCDIESLADFDVIFSIGNEIANQLHKSFLSHYEHLYLFFDMDLGGLTIAKNLTNTLPTKNMPYVYPHDIHERLARVVQLEPNTTISTIMTIANDYPQYTDVANILIKHSKKLEQESYLKKTI